MTQPAQPAHHDDARAAAEPAVSGAPAIDPAVDPADDEPRCPLRPGDYCRLCVPGASGPGNCGLVYLTTSDPALREELIRRWL